MSETKTFQDVHGWDLIPCLEDFNAYRQCHHVDRIEPDPVSFPVLVQVFQGNQGDGFFEFLYLETLRDMAAALTNPEEPTT